MRKLEVPLRLHGNAARDLGIAIVSGRYAEGEKLPIDAVSTEHFGISRSSYREATRILSGKGMVSSRPKAGTVVNSREKWNLLDPDVLAWHFEATPSAKVINDLFELRMIVEPAAAALAARRRSDADLDRLRAAMDVMRREGLSTAAGQAADRDFHETVLGAAGNSMLSALASSVGAAVRWTTIFKFRAHAVPPDRIPDHQRILNAMELQDVEAAKSATAMLVMLGLEDTRALLNGDPA